MDDSNKDHDVHDLQDHYYDPIICGGDLEGLIRGKEQMLLAKMKLQLL
jgi:hypothetical protein